MKLIDMLTLFDADPIDYDLCKNTWDHLLDTAGSERFGIMDMVETQRTVEDLRAMVRGGAFEDYLP